MHYYQIAFRDIKVLSSNAKGDADMLETELHAVINAMSQNKGKSVDALKIVPLLKQSNQIKEQLIKPHIKFIYFE